MNFGEPTGKRKKRVPKVNYIKNINVKRRKRLDEVMKAIAKNPGCSQSHITNEVMTTNNTVSRDVRALERRCLVIVTRNDKKFKPHKHELSKAGERYVANLRT